MTTVKQKRVMTWLLPATAVIVIPLMVWAFSSNPPLGKTGAPGEGTCGDCHGGGGGGGKVSITAASGLTYHPGTKQRITVTLTDPAANEWGYEMTAVQTTKPTTGAGVFKAADRNSGVRTAKTKSYAAQVNDQAGKTKKVTFLLDWTPPSKNVGKITLYVSSNASESVYNNKLTLSPH